MGSNFPSDPDFTEWLDKAGEHSCFTSEIAPAGHRPDPDVIYLQLRINNARFVLLGVLKPEK